MLRWLLRIFFGLVLILILGAVFAPFLIPTKPAPVAELPMERAASKHAASDDKGPKGVVSWFVEIDWFGSRPLKFHLLEASPGLSLGVSTESDPVSPSAPALVLLHGFTLNAYSYLPIIEGLADLGPVIAYDQLPYGLSDKPQPGDWKGANPYAKASALDQLFALLDVLQIEQAVLVGNSSGGTLALEAALADPERIRGLVLLSPWVFSQRPQLPIWLAESPQLWRVSLLLARYLGGEMPLLDLSYADPSQINAQRRAQARIHQQHFRWDLAWAALLQRSLWDPVAVEQGLADVEQPTLVVAGSEDIVVPTADSERVAEMLPNADFIRLEGCGHLPQEECPEALLPVIRDWLSTQAD